MKGRAVVRGLTPQQQEVESHDHQEHGDAPHRSARRCCSVFVVDLLAELADVLFGIALASFVHRVVCHFALVLVPVEVKILVVESGPAARTFDLDPLTQIPRNIRQQDELALAL